MVFCSNKHKINPLLRKMHVVGDHPVEFVTSIRYLGYIISGDLDETGDINRVKSKFYAEFNSVLRTFCL